MASGPQGTSVPDLIRKAVRDRYVLARADKTRALEETLRLEIPMADWSLASSFRTAAVSRKAPLDAALSKLPGMFCPLRPLLLYKVRGERREEPTRNGVLERTVALVRHQTLGLPCPYHSPGGPGNGPQPMAFQ
jgi:hypothetical protein